MSKAIAIITNKTPMKRPDVYRQYVLWTAMHPLEKRDLGIETQKAFAEYYDVNEGTLSVWKTRKDFEPQVDEILQQISVGKTPAVIQGIYQAAVKGNPMSQLLWLQYFKKFNPKTEVVHTNKYELSTGDIRFIIEQLPDELKFKYYGYLREIIDTAQALRRAGQLSDRDAPDAQPETVVPDEADHDARDVPGEKADEVAPRYQSCVRADMVGEVFSNHYQGAARGW
jgi:hypothetical protein